MPRNLLRLAWAHVAAILVIAAIGVPEPVAARTATDDVCVSRVAIVTSPGGFTVGYAFRGDRVRVARRSADGRWAWILTSYAVRGWTRTRTLCRR